MERSQISIFVIVGLVIVILTAFILIKVNNVKIVITTDDKNGEDKNYDAKIKPLVAYIENCLKKTTEEGLVKMGEQGLIYPEVYLASKDTKIAYFYFKGKDYLPEKIDGFEKDVSDYIEENLKSCFGDFSKTGFAVDGTSEIKAEVSFDAKSTIVSIKYPVKTYVEGKQITAEYFSTETKINFQNIYRVVSMINEETYNDPEWINLNFLEDEPYDVNIIKIDKNTWVYEITDYKYGLEAKTFKYRFAVKYDYE